MSEAKKKKEVKIEHVVCSAIATDDGYYKGRIVKTGEKFQFEGVTKNGKFPLWVEPKGKIDKKQTVVKKVKEEVAQEEDSVSSLV